MTFLFISHYCIFCTVDFSYMHLFCAQCIYMRVYMYTYMYVFMHGYVCVLMIRVCMCMHICICIHMYLRVCVYIYTVVNALRSIRLRIIIVIMLAYFYCAAYTQEKVNESSTLCDRRSHSQCTVRGIHGG